MKKFLFLLCLLLTTNIVSGQTLQDLQDLSNKTLRQRINNSPDNTAKIDLLLALGRNVLFGPGDQKDNIKASYDIMKEAEKISGQLNDHKNQGRTLLLAALIANKKGDNDNGLTISQQALSIFIHINDLEDQAEAYIIIGQHYDDAAKRIFYYKKAIAIFEKIQAKERLATTLVDLGDVQAYSQDYEGALKSLQNALNIYRSINYKELTNLYAITGKVLSRLGDLVDALKYELLAARSAESLKDTSLQMASVYNQVSDCYYKLENYKPALDYCNMALLVAHRYTDNDYLADITYSKAKIYASMKLPQQSIDILKTLNESFAKDPDVLVYYYALYSLDLIKLKQYPNAKRYMGKLPLAATQPPNEASIILNIFLNYYMALKQYGSCYRYILQKDSIFKKNNLSKQRAVNELQWFQVDSASGKYKDAIKHYQMFKNVSDSNSTLAKNKQVAFLQIEFETEKKDQSLLLQANNIQLLQQKATFKANETRVNQRLYLAGFGALVLVLGIGYNRFRLKQRSNLQLQQKQMEINAQNVSLQYLLSEKDQLITDKDWLVKEVHHRVKNNLQIIVSLLSSQAAFLDNNAAQEAIQKSQNRVRAISMIHQKLYNSRNLATVDVSLYIAELIANLADSFNISQRGISIVKEIDEMELDQTQAVPLGLIINEAITNAIKYAFDDSNGAITVSLHRVGKHIVKLTIFDNGKGLPENFDISNTSSLGMEMIKALSKQLGGTFLIRNNNGVEISLEFKLQLFSSTASPDGYTTIA